MRIKITTKYGTVASSGAGKITARGMGRQKSIRYDPSESISRNHAAAAYSLINKIADTKKVNLANIECVDDNGGYTFTIEVN